MAGMVLLIAGLVLSIAGADWLVRGGSQLARRANVSDLVIGLTVIAFGTSLPELTVNVFAAVSGNPGVAIGNIAGSNIANVLLILGLSAMIFPLEVGRGTVWKEIPFSLLAGAVLWVLVADRRLTEGAANVLSRADGLILMSFFIIFLYYTAGIAARVPGLPPMGGALFSVPKILVFIVCGLAGLIAGGKLVVTGAVSLANRFGISEGWVAATIVAVGTSFPELATSAVAAFRRNPDIAVGNVVGSNLFNIFFVLSISSLIRPLEMPGELFVSIAMVLVASAMLFAFMFTGRRGRLDRREGLVMLAVYFGYIFVQYRMTAGTADIVP